MIDRKRLLVLCCTLLACQAEDVPQRTGKYISLFNVVKFKNERCTSNIAGSGTVTVGTVTSTPNREGLCYSAEECSDNGGKAQGSCASGFGVCCVFTADAGTATINQNCTYLRNAGFPAALTTTDAIKYTINKCDQEVCALRLDFDTFNILGPANTNEVNGGVCVDTLKVASSSYSNYPTICGENAGQHIYVEIGQNSGDTATIDLTFNGASTARKWDIKVSQVKCGRYAPPEGCFQYFTGNSGTIKTFNFDAATANQGHLQNQRYTSCIRQEEGSCCVEYMPCAGVPNAWSLFESVNGGAPVSGAVDASCVEDYIQGGQFEAICNGNANIATRICGTQFTAVAAGAAKGTAGVDATICDCSAPFGLTWVTDATPDLATQSVLSRGACLTYRQIPC